MAWPNQPPPGTNPAIKPEITPPAIVAVASGVIMFLSSFLAWVKFDDDGFSAWTTDFGFFPVSLFAPLAGLLVAAIVAARVFLKGSLPDAVGGFTLLQLQQVVAVFALALVFGYLVMDRGGADLGAGYWLNLLGAFGLVAAAVMEFLAARSSAGMFGSSAGRFGAQPQAYGQPGAGYPQSSHGQPYQQPQGQAWQPGQYPSQGQQAQPGQYQPQGQPGQPAPYQPPGQPGQQYPPPGQPTQPGFPPPSPQQHGQPSFPPPPPQSGNWPNQG